MTFWEILAIGVALSMDACAVGMTNGMTDCKMPLKRVLIIALFFGFFQFLMPVIGYFITGVVADAFLGVFEKISCWVSFALLAFLGGKMIFETVKEAREKQRTDTCCPLSPEKTDFSYGKLLLQAVATSIDALAVGVTLQMAALGDGLALGVWGATGVIGVVTLFLSAAAVYIGKRIGDKLADKANLLGGIVLVAIGLKILIEGLL